MRCRDMNERSVSINDRIMLCRNKGIRLILGSDFPPRKKCADRRYEYKSLFIHSNRDLGKFRYKFGSPWAPRLAMWWMNQWIHCPAPRLRQEVIPYISAFDKSQPKKMVKLQAQKEFRSIKQWSEKRRSLLAITSISLLNMIQIRKQTYLGSIWI